MRLWTLHPKMLDTKGLVALWREGLLALNVLQGKTKGYKNHPQLDRFKPEFKTLVAYLHTVVDEAEKRNYKFNRAKLPKLEPYNMIKVSIGQFQYEWNHLRQKLLIRDEVHLSKLTYIALNDVFYIDRYNKNVESWEKI